MSADVAVNDAPVQELVSRTPNQLAWERFKRNKAGIVAAVVTLIFLIAAFASPIITGLWHLDPEKPYVDQLTSYGMPKNGAAISWAHPFGIEPQAGRDVFAMLLYGSRISFTLAIIAGVATISLGLIIGTTVGYFGGWVDATVGRFSDFLLSFPQTFFIVALSLPLVQRVQATGLAQGNTARIVVLILFFAVFGWPAFARIIRSQVLSLRERDFVMAARSLGASTNRILFRELMPNLWSPTIVYLSLMLPSYLAAEAVFSYLGVGVQPPASTWGIVLSDSINYWQEDPAYLMIPAGMLIVIVLALNVLGDAIRDALDPKADR